MEAIKGVYKNSYAALIFFGGRNRIGLEVLVEQSARVLLPLVV